MCKTRTILGISIKKNTKNSIFHCRCLPCNFWCYRFSFLFRRLCPLVPHRENLDGKYFIMKKRVFDVFLMLIRRIVLVLHIHPVSNNQNFKILIIFVIFSRSDPSYFSCRNENIRGLFGAYQSSAWDGIIPSHPVPSHPIPSHGTEIFKNTSHGMGWDGDFLYHPIPWDENFFEYSIPSHGTNIFCKKFFLLRTERRHSYGCLCWSFG